MAKVSIAKRAYDFEKGLVTFSFMDKDKTTITVDPSTLGPDVQKKLMLNGVSQKLGDTYADSDSNPDVAVASFKAGLEALQAGKWSQRVAGEGGAKHTILVEALSRAAGKTVEEAAKVVEALDKDQRKQLRGHEAIAAAIVKIEQERLAAKAAKLTSTGAGADLSTLFGG